MTDAPTRPQRANTGSGTERPGGRTHRNTEAIHRAVLTLLESHGLEFTFQDIADVSGVSRRTLHRRWPDRNAIVADTLDHYYRQLQVETTGTFRLDLRSYLRAFRDFSGTPVELAINGLAAASRDVDFARANAESWKCQRDALAEILRDAQDRGDLAPAIDLGMLQLQLISPVTVAASIIRHPMTDTDIDTLIDQTLAGAARDVSD